MYKKGTALELQFSPARLNDGAGDPYWIDLTEMEARQLHNQLGRHLQREARGNASALVVILDSGRPAEIADATPAAQVKETSDLKQWVCVICGWIYDEAVGDPEHGIPAGTRWNDVPENWRCPLCDVGKEDFALVEF